MKTIKLTMAQALVKYLMAQKTIVDGQKVPLIPGVYGIFGHGNVSCLSEALVEVREKFPTWRGQNEQSMALAGVAYAKAVRRKQVMAVTTSIGPGATNVITAAGVAHANRLPLLIICGDTFVNRRPDPVLQQVEHFHSPSTSVNDSFKPVSRYWDRIYSPEQIISTLPQAIATMLDPADCGPAFIGIPQDIQAIAFDYPESFFAEVVHEVPRPRADANQLERAIEAIKNAERPLIISGGGVLYSEAADELRNLAERRRIPVCETIAGRSSLTHYDPVNIGPLGILGSTSANEMAAKADVVIAIGTRLQDFTTGSWTVFSHDCQIVSINAARFDAVKHKAISVVGDALVIIQELDQELSDWRAAESWFQKGQQEYKQWNELLESRTAKDGKELPRYAQVIGAINRNCAPSDRVISAAGGLPGELTKNWKTKNPGTFDCEFGFSCMGYEIAGGWGAAKLTKDKPGVDTIVFVGDGSYMMMNSDIYSSVLDGNKMIVIVCDNGGYGIINRLQNHTGGASYNNLLKDCNVEQVFSVDFIQNAKSMGALGEKVKSIDELEEAFLRAKAADRTYVIQIDTDPFDWTPGDAWWDVAVPEVSNREEVRQARSDHDEQSARQRIGV
ncbi:3D-(3,5/4)-trihydroxycyclohexane-1,2-dione acylhydrolase (decyclizing) [Colwellia demingiae]|uniref:3D-(3,5/4)-trihydroxycyclohexane-1,2-dione acylhydrolase (Decyclizing) n=1 Tax=Colwellia demingiae TaxID=89401 RepID=A0A5C6Q6N4_9GAMM|nr:3D-(3,5/4)-trihydroxycyclohexane-1,2-dione acylhydrolase (decyclizing) [Colwellia demingiae]TWX64350.1 3D-(3,5/4)-trihydroxycyclohexane-1,2-dione acylhydrolase (decyclizing) [Colwellia demingiae]